MNKGTYKRCAAPIVRTAKTGPIAAYCSYDCKRLAAYHRRIETGGYERDRAKRLAEYVPKPITTRQCTTCNRAFTAKRVDAKFCSTRCSTHFKRINPDGSCVTTDCHRTAEARGLCATCWKRDGRATGRIASDPWDDRRKANYHRRRALKVATQVEDIIPRAIYERDGWTCGLCALAVDQRKAWPDPLSPSLDHVTPLSKGGTHTHDNVQLAHLTCNVSKGNRVA